MEDSSKQLRSFGLVVGSAFAIIGVWPRLFRGYPLRTWATGLSCFLIISAIVLPAILKPLYTVWMKVGSVLGWLNSRLILGLVFYVVFTPAGVFMRLFKRDPLCREFLPRENTYRIQREPRSASHMKHQF